MWNVCVFVLFGLYCRMHAACRSDGWVYACMYVSEMYIYGYVDICVYMYVQCVYMYM